MVLFLMSIAALLVLNALAADECVFLQLKATASLNNKNVSVDAVEAYGYGQVNGAFSSAVGALVLAEHGHWGHQAARFAHQMAADALQGVFGDLGPMCQTADRLEADESLQLEDFPMMDSCLYCVCVTSVRNHLATGHNIQLALDYDTTKDAVVAELWSECVAIGSSGKPCSVYKGKQLFEIDNM
eukprot:gnl/TRDRNA2_/TRDRNA2_181570_c0_seq1.p1 gnl/TRDRNA2_/TRDRNA2_181570_c0~~gnl/TRDRNA2_/TRDRNA2_181570_c0_seq1.p1  ORF type:complete len:185 (+),score=26.50 gnl/TRDRNA2_/TRDRNA2_181570_c0_seq1:73-627(+)